MGFGHVDGGWGGVNGWGEDCSKKEGKASQCGYGIIIYSACYGGTAFDLFLEGPLRRIGNCLVPYF